MALEAKFAELKIDDVSSIVDIVKKEGVEKSGLADNIAVLAARCDSSNDTEALAALKVVKTLAEECPETQAFTKECLAICKFKLDVFLFVSKISNYWHFASCFFMIWLCIIFPVYLVYIYPFFYVPFTSLFRPGVGSSQE
jgi:hypothetical protein